MSRKTEYWFTALGAFDLSIGCVYLFNFLHGLIVRLNFRDVSDFLNTAYVIVCAILILQRKIKGIILGLCYFPVIFISNYPLWHSSLIFIHSFFFTSFSMS